MSEATPHLFQVGDWRADANQNLMWHGSQTAHLEPKAMAILQYLVINANEVISRKELFDKFWKNQVVTEDALNRAMWNIRRSLGDTPNNPKYIATIRNRGYKLIAPITFFEDPRIEKHKQSVQQSIKGIASSTNDVLHSPSVAAEPLQHVDKTTSIKPNKKPQAALIIASLISFAVIAFLLSTMKSATQSNIKKQKLNRITYSQSQNVMPSITRNGEHLVYIAKEQNQANRLIYLDRVKNETFYLGDKQYSYSYPAIHHDNNVIAVIVNKPNEKELALLKLNDENAHQKIISLQQSSSGLSWHPKQNLLAYTQAHPVSGKSSIFTVHTQLKNPQPITNPKSAIKDESPKFSPQGEHIAFIRHLSQFEQAVFIVDLSGKVQKIGQNFSNILSFTWLSHNQLMLALPEGLFKLSLNGELIPENIDNIDNNNFSTKNLTYIAELNTLFISQVNSTSQIVNYRLNKVNSSHDLTKSQANDINGAVSQNGFNLAFVSNRTGSHKISILQGNKLSHLQASIADYIYDLRWSPDSKNLVAIAKDKNEYYLLVYQTEEDILEKHTLGTSAANLSGWESDNSIVFSQNKAEKWQLFQYNFSTNQKRPLSDISMYQARLTPDKRQIIYIDSTKPGVWLWDRVSAEKLITQEAPALSRSWFVDNDYIYYLTSHESTNQSQLWRINFTESMPEKIGIYPLIDLDTTSQKSIYSFMASEIRNLTGDVWSIEYYP